MALEINSTPLVSDANLQAYYRFEDNWNDTTANGYNLTAVNSPTFVAGKFAKAGDFVVASSQEANRAVASMANAIVSTTQSWMFWINFSSFFANNYIMGRSTGGNWFMSCGEGGNIDWASGLSVQHSVTIPATGEWHHVCFAYNSSTNKISSFLNGAVVQNQVSVTGSVSGAGTNFAIGRIGDYAGYGTFSIDDVAMFNREIGRADLDLIFPSGSKGYAFFM